MWINAVNKKWIFNLDLSWTDLYQLTPQKIGLRYSEEFFNLVWFWADVAKLTLANSHGWTVTSVSDDTPDGTTGVLINVSRNANYHLLFLCIPHFTCQLSWFMMSHISQIWHIRNAAPGPQDFFTRYFFYSQNMVILTSVVVNSTHCHVPRNLPTPMGR